MMIFTCRDTFEDMMTCIYDAWEWALQPGHSHEELTLLREPVSQTSLFCEYRHTKHVDPAPGEVSKCDKVIRTIKQRISYDAFVGVYYAAMNCDEDALDTIYRFLRLGFRVGPSVSEMLTEPCVQRMMELRRNTGNEAHFSREFARFSQITNPNTSSSEQGSLYVCHLSPKNNIVFITAQHFTDRMPSEHWMIIDDERRFAVVHPASAGTFRNKESIRSETSSVLSEPDGSEMYIRYLSEDEMSILQHTEDIEDDYSSLWRAFHDAISIKQRENYKCQRNMFPIWMRKHATEFRKRSPRTS